MALLAFWRSNREHVLNQNTQQIVSNAGDGKLRDGSECSKELRDYLQEAPSDSLYRYAQYCLDNTFNESGLVLQDVINEIGRRLEFEVENGLYRGKKSVIGYDGIWKSQSSLDIIIEAKTTDYITISLDRIAQYKVRLVEEGRVEKSACILIIVGREDTGALEAQIRGSRYAWDMRLISVERLVKLLQIKEKSNDDTTIHQIRELLQPFEYTKIDKIIDVIFATTEDVEQQTIENVEPAPSERNEEQSRRSVRTARDALNEKRQDAVNGFAKKLSVNLLRQRQTLFSTSNKQIRVCVAVSKNYNRSYQPYWYAYHPTWDEFLKDGKQSFFILACMDRSEAYAIPHRDIENILPLLNTTVRSKGQTYWHVAITTMSDGDLAINLSKTGAKIGLKGYAFPL